MKNLIVQCFLILLVSSVCKSQDWQWSKHFGSNGNNDNDYGEIISDNNNDLLLYMQSIPNGNKFYLNNDTISMNSGNFFITKLDNSGNTIWVKQIFSQNSSCYAGHKILVNKLDNSIYLFGAYCNSMTSFCGNEYNSGINSAMYISKYDSNGNCNWAIKIDSTLIDWATASAFDDNGNLYVGAEHWFPARYGTYSVNAGTVISKFDTSGNCIWVKNLCPLTNDGNPRPQLEIKSLKYKSGFLYINAYGNHDTVSIDSNIIIHAGQRGALVAKLTLNADLVWYKEGLGYGPDAGNDGLGIDNVGNVYATGAFVDSINFEGNVMYGGPQPFPVGANWEIYFVKYDSTGTLIWAKHFHAGSRAIERLVTNDAGFSYLVSSFTDSIDIDNYHLYPSQTQEMYLARFSPNGNCLGIKHFGDALGINLAVDNNNDVIVVSQMNALATVDQQTYTSFDGNGWKDIIISKCSEITGIETVGKTRNNELLIYANPTTGKCNITMPDEFKNKNGTLTLTLYDNNGKSIHSYPVKVKDGTIKLDLEYEATGMYLVTLTDGHVIYRGKIMFE